MEGERLASYFFVSFPNFFSLTFLLFCSVDGPTLEWKEKVEVLIKLASSFPSCPSFFPPNCPACFFQLARVRGVLFSDKQVSRRKPIHRSSLWHTLEKQPQQLPAKNTTWILFIHSYKIHTISRIFTIYGQWWWYYKTLQNLGKGQIITVNVLAVCKIRWKGVKTVVNESNYCNCAAVQIQLVLIDTDSDWDGNLKCPQSIEDSSFLHSLAVHCHRSRQSLPRKVATGRPPLEEPLAPDLIARTRRKGRWTRTRTRRKGRWMGKWGKGRQGSTEQRQPWPWWRTILNTTRGTCLCIKTEVSCSGKDWRREAFRMTPQSLDWEVPNSQPCANVPDQSVACRLELVCKIWTSCWCVTSTFITDF